MYRADKASIYSSFLEQPLHTTHNFRPIKFFDGLVSDSENSSSQCIINITTKNKKIEYISFCEYKTEISYKKEKHFQIYFKHKHNFVVQPDESLLTIEEENSDVRRKIFKESCWWQQEDKKV